MTESDRPSLLDRLRHRPKRLVLNASLHCSVPVLVALVCAAYAVIALLFALAYSATDSVSGTQDFVDYLYFSFVTQSTLGLGDYLPVKSGRAIAIAQTMVGMFYTALALSAVVVRVLQRAPTIIFPKVICFDPDVLALRGTIWNRELGELVKLELEAFIRRRPTDGEQPLIALFPLALEKNLPVYLGPMWVGVFETLHAKAPAGTSANALKVDYLAAQDEIHIIVTGISSASNSNFMVRKQYGVDEVRCGKLARTLPDSGYSGEWRDRLYGRFGVVTESQPKRCESCKLAKQCCLKPAQLYRARSEAC